MLLFCRAVENPPMEDPQEKELVMEIELALSSVRTVCCVSCGCRSLTEWACSCRIRSMP